MDIEEKNSSATNGDDVNKLRTLRAQTESILQNAILMTEVGMDIKERCIAGEKYVCYLRSLSIKAGKNINALHSIGKSFLTLAQKLIIPMISKIENVTIHDPSCCYHLKIEYDKLLAVIEKELNDIDDLDNNHNILSNNVSNITERIKYLEAKQKLMDNTFLPRSGSVKSVKSDVDEKYPENWSKDSLIDLDNIVNLPSVPEDIFTTFTNKPSRTSSLSSLKGIRKVKLFLQRAANNSDDEDESSENDDHESSSRIVNMKYFIET